jgi:cytochrome c biogenesis protein CcmG/thiol:disulfide interchange protein DsbE
MRAAAAIPLILFALIATAFFVSLGKRPDVAPSALIDRPLPDFSLKPIAGRDLGLASADLTGEPAILNVFASWCAGCAVEQPLLMRFRKEGVRVYGLNWKDRPGDGARWLARYGDPYERIGDDFDGRVAIDLGVSGAPETFVIDAAGRVRHRHVGPISEGDWAESLRPMMEELKNETATAAAAGGESSGGG